MKIKVSYGYTKNMGNYESQRIDASTEFELDEDTLMAEIKESRQALLNELKKFVHQNIETIPEEKAEKAPQTDSQTRRRRF